MTISQCRHLQWFHKSPSGINSAYSPIIPNTIGREHCGTTGNEWEWSLTSSTSGWGFSALESLCLLPKSHSTCPPAGFGHLSYLCARDAQQAFTAFHWSCSQNIGYHRCCSVSWRLPFPQPRLEEEQGWTWQGFQSPALLRPVPRPVATSPGDTLILPMAASGGWVT